MAKRRNKPVALGSKRHQRLRKRADKNLANERIVLVIMVLLVVGGLIAFFAYYL